MRKKYVLVSLGVCLAILFALYLRQSLLLNFLTEETLTVWVKQFGIWAPIMYMSLYAVGSLVFIPGSPMTLIGGVLFGPVYGTLYTVIGATVGAVLAFLCTRMIGSKILPPSFFSRYATLEKYNKKIATHGLLTVLFLRFVPLFPFNGLNFALGLTKISFKDYVVGTFFGIIPGTFAYVYFGDALSSLSPLKVGSAVAVIVLLSLVARFVIKKYDAK